MSVAPEELREFESQRPRLFSIAYRMLGSASEAEDAVQDTFLRWHEADRGAVRTPAAWLTKVLTNLCLNRLTSARAQRESYPGPWLPEPVATGGEALGPLDTAERRESVSLAFLLLLERLTPPERAVFVLREAFDYGHAEIAELLGYTEPNCQQLYRRARQRVAEGRSRFTASRDHGKRVAGRFLAAARDGDLPALERLLADDVVSWADGGGKTVAARLPVRGAGKVARYLGWLTIEVPRLEFVETELNGEPGAAALVDGAVLVAITLDVVGEQVAGIRIVNNPDKLAYLSAQLTGRARAEAF